MIQSVFTSAMGLTSQQRRLDIIADNLANVNTNGFKSATIQFKDALYAAYADPADPNSDKNLQVGLGVLDASTYKNFTQGQVNVSQNKLDFCLDGQGFFAVMDTDGSTVYTRKGTFALSNEADGSYIVDPQGCYLLDENGQKIKLQGSLEDFSISANGEIREGKNEAYAKVAVYGFKNMNGLSSIGRGFYAPTANSGEPEARQDTDILQNMLESSNTDVAMEITRMIRAQKALSFASRALRTADDMEGQANTIRG